MIIPTIFSFKECHIFHMRYIFLQEIKKFYMHLCQTNIKLKIMNKYINISNNSYKLLFMQLNIFFRIIIIVISL